MLLASGAAITWAAVRKSSGAAKVAEELDRFKGKQDLLTRPLQVPKDFVGMHAHRWPADTASASAPTYEFGATRSHDHEGLFWNDLHLGPSRYRWDRMDRWVEAHSAAGRTLIYTLYGTPAWLASETGRTDLYGRAGGAAPPSDLAPLADFVQALFTRYNASGRGRLAFLETWNEPHFDGPSRDFWWGTAGQLVSVGRTIYRAAKGIAQDVRVLSPGFVADPASAAMTPFAKVSQRHRSMSDYLTASDGQGGTGARWCDGIAFHTYNVALSGPHVAGLDEVREISTSLECLGLSLPLYNTECGFVAPHPFRELSPARQAVFLKRLGALQAACGIQALCFYSHDDEFVGNPSVHPEVADAIDTLQRHLAGATLRQVSFSGAGGPVHVTTDAGEFVW